MAIIYDLDDIRARYIDNVNNKSYQSDIIPLEDLHFAFIQVTDGYNIEYEHAAMIWSGLFSHEQLSLQGEQRPEYIPIDTRPLTKADYTKSSNNRYSVPIDTRPLTKADYQSAYVRILSNDITLNIINTSLGNAIIGKAPEPLEITPEYIKSQRAHNLQIDDSAILQIMIEAAESAPNTTGFIEFTVDPDSLDTELTLTYENIINMQEGLYPISNLPEIVKAQDVIEAANAFAQLGYGSNYTVPIADRCVHDETLITFNRAPSDSDKPVTISELHCVLPQKNKQTQP